MRTASITFLFGIVVIQSCQGWGETLYVWRSSAGTELRAGFESVDSDTGTVTLLVPKTVQLSSLDPASRRLAERLSRKSKFIAAEGREDIADQQNSKSQPPPATTEPDSKPNRPQETRSESRPQSNLKWYEGGTLTDKTGKEWRNATARNKLASCADMVAALWSRKKLVPVLQSKILSMDDMKVLAQNLSDNLDAAFKPIPDQDVDTMLANQDVATFATILFATMGWIP